ncbi:MAG: hypothetical protein JEY71_16430 [Sphaerochaeta sp.]|nr:hypothetical protein [Sphaerochaeta sp.]
MAEATGFDLYTITDCPKDLHDFDVVVMAGSIHAGSVSIKEYVVANWPSLKDKKVIIILTSGTSNREVINKVVNDSFSSEIVNTSKVFPVGGRYMFNRMSFIDRSIIKLVAFFSKHPETKKGMLTEKEEMNRENLQEALDFLHG